MKLKKLLCINQPHNILLLCIAIILFILTLFQLFSGQLENGFFSLAFLMVSCYCLILSKENFDYVEAISELGKNLHHIHMLLNDEIEQHDNMKSLYEETSQLLKSENLKHIEMLNKINDLEVQLQNKQNRLTLTIDQLKRANAECEHNKREISKLSEQLINTQNLLQQATEVAAEKDNHIAELQEKINKERVPYIAKPSRKKFK